MDNEQGDIIFRYAEFTPPCWQLWSLDRNQLLAAFATKALLDTAIPALIAHLKEQS